MSEQNVLPKLLIDTTPTALVTNTFQYQRGNAFGAGYSAVIGGTTGSVAEVVNAVGSIATDPLPALAVASLEYFWHLDNGEWTRGLGDSLETLATLGVSFGATVGAPLNASLIMGYTVASNDVQAAHVLLTNADARAASQHGVVSAANNYAFNGATFDRLRTGSATNLSAADQSMALVTTGPGDWSINHTPAANTPATITRAAGAAGVRHVCTSITATLIGLAASAETTVLVNLRDGATGAGAILWSTRLLVAGTAGSETGVSLSGLNIVGSAATAMTLEFAAAGGASTFETVAMTGHDVV